MATNEERREIAEEIRKAAQHDFLGFPCFTSIALERLFNLEVKGAILGVNSYTRESATRMADLIEPDYTSEESGYFILPKPKDPLICRYSSVDGSVYDIINENVREWQKQIDENIQQRLFETFRKTCHDADHMGDAIKCSKCGEITRETLYWVDVGEDARTVKGRRPLFCARCGAKVIDNANF